MKLDSEISKHRGGLRMDAGVVVAIIFALLTVVAADARAERTLSIVKTGAVGDGQTLDTTAIQKAIDELGAKGGGTVVIPQGEFLSGAIFLKPGVNLRLDKDAVLKGSTNINDYPMRMTRIEGHFQEWIPALVNATNTDHLRITGEGTIRGGGEPFWDEFWNRLSADHSTRNLDVKRPRNIFIQDSKDVTISGISLRDSGFWNLHLFRCQKVLIDKVDIRSRYHSPSTDGVDVDSCRDVTIRGCYISVSDDNIALKGNKGTSATDDKSVPPVEHIRVEDCTFGLGNAALTLGSEATVVRDVVIEHCRLTGTEKNCVLKLKLRPDTEQHYENISARDIQVDNPLAQVVSIQGWTQYFDLQGKPAPSQFVSNVTLANITGNLRDFGLVDGPSNSVVANLTFKDIDVKLKNPEVAIRNVKGLKVSNMKINGVPYDKSQSVSRAE